MKPVTHQIAHEQLKRRAFRFHNIPELKTLLRLNTELKQFRDERSLEWQYAQLWSIPEEARLGDKERFRALNKLRSLAEQDFWHSFIKFHCGENAKCSYMFSALHPPDLFYRYDNPIQEPIGHWDYIDYAFSKEIGGTRISRATQELLKTHQIKNSHLIPVTFQFGDTGWRSEQEIKRCAVYLRQAVRSVRLIGAILHASSQHKEQLFRSPPIGDEVTAESYDFVFINHPYSNNSAYQLAHLMLKPQGFLVTSPHSFSRYGGSALGFSLRLRGQEMNYYLYQK